MGTERRAATTPNKRWALTQEAFDALLDWLDEGGGGRERAGARYEEIRRRLVKIFACRGCYEAEELADETINVVAKRVGEIGPTYEGDRALYFYGVANKVYLEWLRRRRVPPPPPPPSPPDFGQEYECLEHCMEKLDPGSRDLVLQYYREEKRDKIEHRRTMASKLGIALNALRIRAFRIRAALRECVGDCLVRWEG